MAHSFNNQDGSVASHHRPSSRNRNRGQSLDLQRHTSGSTLDPPRSLRSLNLDRHSRAEERAAARSGYLVGRGVLARHTGVLGNVDTAPSALHPYTHLAEREDHRRSSRPASFASGQSGVVEELEKKGDIEHLERKEADDNSDAESEDLVAVQVTDKGDEIVYPDGGTQAWLVVLGGFCANIGGFGLTASVGAFQSYYEKNLLAEHTSSQIAWIGSVMAAICFGGSAFTGPLVDRWGCKVLLGLGTAILTLAFVLLSFCKEYYQVFLCQGVVMAWGMNLLFIPPMGIVGQWFFLRRGIAFGILCTLLILIVLTTVTGSSVGALVWPAIIANVPPKIGFPWTMRLMALMVLVLGIISVLLMRARLPPRPKGPYFCFSEFKNPAYSFIAFSNPFYVFAFFSYLTFIGTYGRVAGLGDLAPYLLIISNGSSGIGRLLAGFAADMFGVFNVVVVSIIALVILTFAWLAMKTAASLIVFCVLFGMISGAPVSLQGPLITSTLKDPRLAGTTIGQAMLI